MKQKTAIPTKLNVDLNELIELGFLIHDEKVYKLTPQAKIFITHLDNYFIQAKKKTDIQLMGKNFVDQINIYREVFPNKRLPSGKPARVNVKMLSESFRWFFETYDYTWETILLATEKYVSEYEMKRFEYMRTSQYFLRKQNLDKSFESELANYCELVISGAGEMPNYFKETIV